MCNDNETTVCSRVAGWLTDWKEEEGQEADQREPSQCVQFKMITNNWDADHAHLENRQASLSANWQPEFRPRRLERNGDKAAAISRQVRRR